MRDMIVGISAWNIVNQQSTSSSSIITSSDRPMFFFFAFLWSWWPNRYRLFRFFFLLKWIFFLDPKNCLGKNQPKPLLTSSILLKVIVVKHSKVKEVATMKKKFTQIWSLTVFPPTWTTFDPNSTPIVWVESLLTGEAESKKILRLGKFWCCKTNTSTCNTWGKF